jgi:hypothetical protein
MNFSNEDPTRTLAKRQRQLRKIERAFHIRAFGEELARINFLPERRRKAAVAAMIDHARSKGVKLGRSLAEVTP